MSGWLWTGRLILVGSGLLLLTLVAGLMWFITIPLGLVALVVFGVKARKVGQSVVKEVNAFLDEPVERR